MILEEEPNIPAAPPIDTPSYDLVVAPEFPPALVSAASEPFEASHLLRPSLSECVLNRGFSIKFHLLSDFQQSLAISGQLVSPFLVFQTVI